MNALLLAAALFAQTPAPIPAPMPVMRSVEVVLYPKAGQVEAITVALPIEVDPTAPLSEPMIDQIARLVKRLLADLGN